MCHREQFCPFNCAKSLEITAFSTSLLYSDTWRPRGDRRADGWSGALARTAPVCWTGTGAAGSSGVTDPSCCHGNESYSRPPWVGHVSLGSVWGPRRQSARERTVARRAELDSGILSTRQCDRSPDQPDRFVVVVNICRFRGVVVLSRRRCATLRSSCPRRVRDHLVTKLLRVATNCDLPPRSVTFVVSLLEVDTRSCHGEPR